MTINDFEERGDADARMSVLSIRPLHDVHIYPSMALSKVSAHAWAEHPHSDPPLTFWRRIFFSNFSTPCI